MARCFLLLSMVTVGYVLASRETMKGVTYSFLKVLDECKRELNLPENILVDLYYFWKEETALVKRDAGCALVCMSKKLNLLDSDGKIHHGNAQEFALKHGAAEEVASQLVATVHECEKQHEVHDDLCLRALEVAKCFRDGIRRLNWAPNLEVVVGEVLTEV